MGLFEAVTIRNKAGGIFLPIFVFALLVGGSAQGQSCSSQVDQAIQSCGSGLKNPSNNTGGCQQGQNVPGGGGAQSAVAGAGAAGVGAGQGNCETQKQMCDQACQQAMQQAQDPGTKNKARQDQQRCDQAIKQFESEGAASQSNLSQGASGGLNTQAAANGSGGSQSCSPSQPPQIPPPPPSPSPSPQPSSTPIPTPTPSPTTCAIGDTTCESNNILDNGLGSQFADPKPTPTPGNNSDTNGAMMPAVVSPMGAAPGVTGGGGGGGSGGGGASGSFGSNIIKPNTDGTTQNSHTEAHSGASGGPVPEGSASGGSGSAANGANADYQYKPLSAYLPGGAKQPDRGLAAVSAKNMAHPDITSKHSDMFDRIRMRMEVLCKMKELVGCN